MKYGVSSLINNIYLNLIEASNIGYYIFKILSLLIKKIKLYEILKKINIFIYRLKFLSSILKIYFIILIIYLK